MRKARIGFWVCGVLIVIAVLSCFGVRQHLHNKARNQVGALTASLPWLDEITYRDLRVAPLRGDIHLRQVRLFTADLAEPLEIGACTIRRLSAMPHAGQILVSDFKLPLDHPLAHKLKPVLETMGYADIHVQVELEYHFNPQQRRFVLEHLQIEAEEMGRLRTRVVLENIDPAQLYGARNQRFYFLMLLSNVALAEGQMAYTDASLIRRLLSIAALMQGETLQTYRRNLSNHLVAQIQAANSPELQRALAVLKEFIETPESIALRVRPEKPIALLSLLWPRDRIELLESLRLEVN